MFDIGGGELILILVVVLLLFGPKKIPEVMASVGKGIRQFKQAQNQLKEQLRDISADIEKAGEQESKPKKSFSVVASYNEENEAEQPQTIADSQTNESNNELQNELKNEQTNSGRVNIRPAEGAIARTNSSADEDALSQEIK